MFERFGARKSSEGTPPPGASERDLSEAWDKEHANLYARGREVAPEEIAAAEGRLSNVMGRCQRLWKSTVDEKGTTFTQKSIAIESAYKNVRDMLFAAGITLVPAAAFLTQAVGDKYTTAIDSAVASGATGALLLTMLTLAKMVEQIRANALSVSTKEIKI